MNEVTPEIGEVGDVIVKLDTAVDIGRYRGIVVSLHPTSRKYSLVMFFDPPQKMQDYCNNSLSHQNGLWACQRPEWQKDEARTDEEASAQAAITLGGLDALKALLAELTRRKDER